MLTATRPAPALIDPQALARFLYEAALWLEINEPEFMAELRAEHAEMLAKKAETK